MFIGQYSHLIDPKKRLAIPSKFRKQLGGGVVITRGIDNCLFLYPAKEWKILAEKLSKLPISKSNTRAFSRLMLAGAMDAEIDSQGRILIPDYLKEYASLKDKAVIAGLYNRLEIWDEATWNSYKSRTEKQSSDIAEQLGELGV
ncbi:division/cell wall cluster transcriptional repressor MraZ [Patescibacteria group bacterium]|nr:division/cell wall cluster transcriptional repressor MraZ [Patescibacteria group bacterium]MBU4000465.1 division/cell wall cluster transcriptional repressor MraZ [Patescibacteria group bacterium]MBU4056777.1 division/cell wall cluster transcriptional repressor MraZ [Patescibacteria group bacterium]MBU4368180.1 division/cell wall cluster transcriptional repressor MraZ [Patescibacteria group bacterium]